MDFSVLLKQIELLFVHFGYFFIFLGTLIETSPFGWLIPGGILVALGGFYAFDGTLSLVLVLLFAFCGTILTLLLGYLIGKKTGMRLAKFLHQEKNARRAKILLEKHGAVILTTSLLTPATRFWVAYIAGAQKYNVIKFIMYASIASLTYVSLIVSAGYIAGTGKNSLEQNLAQIGAIFWFVLLIVGGFLYWKLKDEFKEAQDELIEEEIVKK